MGIVKKQAYKNTIALYAGMVIAYINTVLLFPPIVGKSDFGFYNLIITVSVMYSLAASMGVPSIIARYFAVYRTDDRKHRGFMHWVAWLALLGFVGTTVLYLLFKPIILDVYAQKSPLFVKYYYYIIPLTLFIVTFNYLEMSGRVIYRTIYSNFLQFVALRLSTTVMLLCIAQKWLTFEQFVFGYIIANGIISLLLLIDLLRIRAFQLKLDRVGYATIPRKTLVQFGLFTLTSSTLYVLLEKVDTLMLSGISGDAVQGVYTWYFNIAMVIGVPAQALGRTTYTIVADSWAKKDMQSIANVYSKTSIIQMLAGSLLFVGIFVNRDNLFALARNKDFTNPQYFNMFIVIGLGFLANITGGLNTYIIATSHKYRLNTFFTLIACVICVGLNFLLIPKMAGMGAAIAYLVTIVTLNFCSWLYIKLRFKMQPFTAKHLIVVIVATAAYFVGAYFWRLPNVWADIAVRSIITGAVFLVLAYTLKISADVNEKVDELLARFVK